MCDGRLKVNFVGTDAQERTHLVEVIDDELAGYLTEANEYRLRARGRQAQKLAKEHGYAGYFCISKVEWLIDEGAVRRRLEE